MLCLVAVFCTISPPSLHMESDQDATTIFAGGQPLISYVHSETPAPDGENPLYKRSAYIHPLRSPGGAVLTRIQPPDHIHHYGIWNPWTRTTFGEHRVDFWNLKEGQGTVRFVEYLERTDRKDKAGFTVRQDHIYFMENGKEGIAIEETWDLLLFNVQEKRYTTDLNISLSTPLEDGITLEAFRYGGGIGFRATEMWHPHNSTVITSEGKNRETADGTEARWTIIEGESPVPEGRSGILFLSHPSNQSHPEPMRVWPPHMNKGMENVYFQFCPIRHRAWVLEHGTTYSLRYRMVVFDGAISAREAEAIWLEFAGKTK